MYLGVCVETGALQEETYFCPSHLRIARDKYNIYTRRMSFKVYDGLDLIRARHKYFFVDSSVPPRSSHEWKGNIAPKDEHILHNKRCTHRELLLYATRSNRYAFYDIAERAAVSSLSKNHRSAGCVCVCFVSSHYIYLSITIPTQDEQFPYLFVRSFSDTNNCMVTGYTQQVNRDNYYYS